MGPARSLNHVFLARAVAICGYLDTFAAPSTSGGSEISCHQPHSYLLSLLLARTWAAGVKMDPLCGE